MSELQIRLQNNLDHLRRLRPTPVSEAIANDIAQIFAEQMGASYTSGFKDAGGFKDAKPRPETNDRECLIDCIIFTLGVGGLLVLYFSNAPEIKSLSDFLIAFFACWYLLITAGIRIAKKLET